MEGKLVSDTFWLGAEEQEEDYKMRSKAGWEGARLIQIHY